MKHFLSVLAVAGLAAAQSWDEVTRCARESIKDIDWPGCDDTDVACYCNNPPFIESVKNAMQMRCSEDEQTKAISLAQNICRNVGVPILGDEPILNDDLSATHELPSVPNLPVKKRWEGGHNNRNMAARAYYPTPAAADASSRAATPSPSPYYYRSGHYYGDGDHGDGKCTCGGSGGYGWVPGHEHDHGHDHDKIPVPAGWNTPVASPSFTPSPSPTPSGASPFAPFTGAATAQSVPSVVAAVSLAAFVALAFNL